jgi:3-deoxy-7-phosphoheptulonate synthase
MASGSQAIAAVMIESNLVEGNQKISDNMTYGQSVTDACIDWQTTEEVLESFSKAVQARRLATR